MAKQPDSASIVTEQPILVRAKAPGTYPDPGCWKAIFRETGDTFQVKCRRDLADWMHEIKSSEPYVEPVKPEIPQTTAGQKVIATPMGQPLPPI